MFCKKLIKSVESFRDDSSLCAFGCDSLSRKDDSLCCLSQQYIKGLLSSYVFLRSTKENAP